MQFCIALANRNMRQQKYVCAVQADSSDNFLE